MMVDYGDLPGEGKTNKARELVTYLENRGRIPELVKRGVELRPLLDWAPTYNLLMPVSENTTHTGRAIIVAVAIVMIGTIVTILISIFVWTLIIQNRSATPTSPITQAPIPPTPLHTTATINANQGWQSTGRVVKKDDHITISYISGQWTVNYQNLNSTDPYVDADGYSRPNRIGNPPLAGANDGALIGRIGTESPFLVGKYKFLIAPVEGELSLRINDDDPGAWPGTWDNRGSIDVQILISR
jgi:hypothetical protein